jgi:hypothetical protein
MIITNKYNLPQTFVNIMKRPTYSKGKANISATEHPGTTGKAFWRTQQFGSIRVRMVEYTPGYLADHWCEKGHILLCLSGSLRTELKDGRIFDLKPGMSYQVADGAEPHQSSTHTGATLFIVD